MLLLMRILGLLTVLIGVQAQFPAVPDDVTVLESKFGDGVYVSFKEVSEFSFRFVQRADIAAGDL